MEPSYPVSPIAYLQVLYWGRLGLVPPRYQTASCLLATPEHQAVKRPYTCAVVYAVCAVCMPCICAVCIRCVCCMRGMDVLYTRYEVCSGVRCLHGIYA